MNSDRTSDSDAETPVVVSNGGVKRGSLRGSYHKAGDEKRRILAAVENGVIGDGSP